MKLVSIDKTANGAAVKLSDNASVSPDRLMEFLGEDATAAFSPNGILRFEVNEDLIGSVRRVLERIRA